MTGPVAAEAVLDHIPPDADLIVSMANGEPVGLIDVLEAHHERLHRVRIHQMHALHPRPSIEGKCGDDLRHVVSYFLSPVTRPSYWAGRCDLVPNHFSEMPHLLQGATKCSLVLAAASPPDRHGYLSLGTNAEYVAALIGRVAACGLRHARGRAVPARGGDPNRHAGRDVRPRRPPRPPAAAARQPRRGRDQRGRARAAVRGRLRCSRPVRDQTDRPLRRGRRC